MPRKPKTESLEDVPESLRADVSPIHDAIMRERWDDVQECVLVAQVLVDQYGLDAPLKAEASASMPGPPSRPHSGEKPHHRGRSR